MRQRHCRPPKTFEEADRQIWRSSGSDGVSELVEIAGGVDIFADRAVHPSATDGVLMVAKWSRGHSGQPRADWRRLCKHNLAKGTVLPGLLSDERGSESRGLPNAGCRKTQPSFWAARQGRSRRRRGPVQRRGFSGPEHPRLRTVQIGGSRMIQLECLGHD
jgi:hypothetical protein